jgi:hypothetical protein
MEPTWTFLTRSPPGALRQSAEVSNPSHPTCAGGTEPLPRTGLKKGPSCWSLLVSSLPVELQETSVFYAGVTSTQSSRFLGITGHGLFIFATNHAAILPRRLRKPTQLQTRRTQTEEAQQNSSREWDYHFFPRSHGPFLRTIIVLVELRI